MESSLLLAQLLCLLLFHSTSSLPLNSSFSSSQVLCPHDQSHALLQFKSSFSINTSASFNCSQSLYDCEYAPPYPKTESWKEGTDCCSWNGVTCDLETGNVIRLDLSSSMLYGTFHSHNNSLFLLSHLQKLDLSNNYFIASNISSQFGHLLHLTHLNLNRTRFQGHVPLELSHLSNLISLDLSWNYGLKLEAIAFNNLIQNLTKLRELGLNEVDMSMVALSSFMNFSSSLSSLNLQYCELPSKFLEYVNLPSGLVSLDLSDNNLKLDTNCFVKLVQNLTKLKEFDMSYVNMSSVAPSSFMNFSSSLTSLKLRECSLQGKFLEIFHLSKLIALHLSYNYNLTMDQIAFDNLLQSLPNLRELGLGSVNMSSIAPTSLMNFSSSLSSLRLSYCELRGEFPDNFLQRPNLQLLDLIGNDNLTGLLPRSNWSSSLQYLGVSWTKISINLEPDFICNLRSLKYLDLWGCNFNGSNLAVFSNLTQLTQLDLSYNNFNGQIPPSFGSLQQLTILDLSYNNFKGQIPPSFGNLQQLIYLRLSSNSLSGSLPFSFTNLKQLISLDLSNNSLSGPLPAYFSVFTQLTNLDLSNNFFNTTIPSSLFSLPQLGHLDLKNNQLNGSIGQFQSNSLSYIDLSNNSLHGSIHSSIFNQTGFKVLILSSNHKLSGGLPPSICKLKFLQILDLSNNNLTGFIPQCLGNFSNSLSVLHLGINNFHGTIPAIFSEGNSLRYLNFNGNQLQGQISPSLINCRYLELLDLGNNQIDDIFPIFLGVLPNLQILVLQSNKLHGSLTSPTANSSFLKLRIFDLSNNTFSGTLPVEYFNEFQAMMNFTQDFYYMQAENYSYDYSVDITLKGLEVKLLKIQTALSTIDLSLNNFTGEIPKSIGKLKLLKLLNLSHNCLKGNIPPSVGNLTSLESLDLSTNLLTGRIPMELMDLTFLEIFRVAHNQLEGLIPHGKQFNTFNNDSYEENLRLCGFPLSKECEDDSQRDVEQPNIHEKDSGYVGWNAALIGYGCGLVLGLSLGYIVFTTRKPKWFVKKVEGAWDKKSGKSRKKLPKLDGRRN